MSELKDPAKMTQEEIHADVAAAIKACWKIIVDMVMQYEEPYRWKLASRVVNSLWSIQYKPTIGVVMEQTIKSEL